MTWNYRRDGVFQEPVYNVGMKRKEILVVLCAIGVAALAAMLLLHRSKPRHKAAVRHAEVVHQHAVPELDRAAYNAKMRALANIQDQSGCTVGSEHASHKTKHERISRTSVTTRPVVLITKEAVYRPCPAPLWPVHTVYPDAGAVLPFKRIVAYYGNFYSTKMGILGEYPPDKMLPMLTAAADSWAVADPKTPVVPAVDYIVVSAQGLPGKDGRYRMRMPASQIDKAIRLADRIHGLAFLDVQPGWSTVETEVPRLADYLKRPNVELALDPEFALVDGKKPGAWIGTMNAADINFAAHLLAKIVRENHLPPKVLVIHRFTERMVTDYRAIKPLPEVEIVMDMDGFGSPVLKTSTYKSYIERQPVQFTGFKLFYKNDVRIGHHLMTPAEILRLSPRPSYILYQ